MGEMEQTFKGSHASQLARVKELLEAEEEEEEEEEEENKEGESVDGENDEGKSMFFGGGGV